MTARLKGPWMPSYDRQHERSTKQKMQWVRHQSTRQQKRHLRHKAREILDSQDPQVISMGDRVIRAVCHEPDPEFSVLHLFCAAIDAADDTGEPWVVCINYLMEQFEERSQGNMPAQILLQRGTDGDSETPPASPSRLRGLLRGLVARPLRAIHEAFATGHVHPHPGDAHEQHSASDVGYTSREDPQGDGAAEAGAD